MNVIEKTVVGNDTAKLLTRIVTANTNQVEEAPR